MVWVADAPVERTFVSGGSDEHVRAALLTYPGHLKGPRRRGFS